MADLAPNRELRPALTVIDFETTGVVDRFPNEPWQIGLLDLRDDHLQPVTGFESLLRIGDRPFSPHAPGRPEARRHELAVAPTFPELWPRLKTRLLNRPLAAHNVATERKLLRTLAPLHRFGPWIDTLALARRAQPGLGSYALEDLVQTLNLAPRFNAHVVGRGPHDALYDAFACAALLEHILELPGWRDLGLEALTRLH